MLIVFVYMVSGIAGGLLVMEVANGNLILKTPRGGLQISCSKARAVGYYEIVDSTLFAGVINIKFYMAQGRSVMSGNGRKVTVAP